MNNILKTLAVSAIAAVGLISTSVNADADVTREHRAVWCTPYLGHWPSAAITEGNAEKVVETLCNTLDEYKLHGINVIYYHVRSQCDATYKSSYEPWTKYVSGQRGKAPAIDPFQTIIEKAHERGIEVYAWVNPYRYHTDRNGSHGGYDFDYEVTHPEWLISGNSSNTVLNPALPEVQQRILDVVSEIVTNYDLDGMIFDDYFYPQGGTSTSTDAAQYNAYVAAGGTLSQGDWRRNNVNTLMGRINETIKSIKPYVCFGISPAAYSCPPDIEEKYGLEKLECGLSDWQYNTIYSEPLDWLKNHRVDFVSPQLYYWDKYAKMADWWIKAAQKFGRHLYPSTSPENYSNNNKYIGAEALAQEVLDTRASSKADESGHAYFEYKLLNNTTEVYGDKRMVLHKILHNLVYQNNVLTPLRSWNNVRNPQLVSNLKVTDDNMLTWDAVEGARYTVYAVPENITDAEFSCQKEFLEQVRYTNNYRIPNDTIITAISDRTGTTYDTTFNVKTQGYRWAVCVYDRYGNEYSPIFAGQTAKEATPATLTYPVKGESATDLFSFSWNSDASRFILQVAEDAAFTNIIGDIDCNEPKASVTKLDTKLEAGKTYYWRVISMKPNSLDVISAVESFVCAPFTVISPANNATGVSLTPTITWSDIDGAKFTVEISTRNDFSNIVYTATTNEKSITVPERKLCSYTDYYVRATAEKDGYSSVSDIFTFKTFEKNDYTAPVLNNPATNGETIYSNEYIEVLPYTGFHTVTIEICANTKFSSRSSYTKNLTDFETGNDDIMSNIKISGKALVDGTTYYVRVTGKYRNSTTAGGKAVSDIISFVYSANSGIDGVTSNESRVFVTNENKLVIGVDASMVEVYNVNGKLVEQAPANSEMDLNHLANGAYIIKVATINGDVTLKYVK